MKINLNSRTSICAPLEILFRKLERCDAVFPTTDDIESFGNQIEISIMKCNITEGSNSALQFDPCFFLPHLGNALQEYPIDYELYKRFGDDTEEIEQSMRLEDDPYQPEENKCQSPSCHLYETEGKRILACLDRHLVVARCPKGEYPSDYEWGFKLDKFRGLEQTIM